MMEDPLGSDECLPPGWTVQVKVRKNGKRDKYYFSPSSELKFKSKVEVFRHLESGQNKVSIQRVADNVVVEKDFAEGLPPGWMKKTRVATKGDTVRRDSCYIDPVSGYAFRSIKDVDRYLDSGEIGRNAIKPKDTDNSNMEFSSVGETTKPTLSVDMGPSPDLDMTANGTQIPICDNVSTPRSTLVPGRTGEESQEKRLQESGQTQQGTGTAQDRQRRKRGKKEVNLPRRSSKRLAGIEVDPVPELITRSRARRAAAKQSGEGKARESEDNHSNNLPNGAAKQINALKDGSETKCKSESATNTVVSSKSSQISLSYGKFSAPEKLPVKTIEEHGSDNKDQKSFSFWPREDHATTKEHVRFVDNVDNLEAKFDYNFTVPLRELLKDPCIKFAVEVLNGETFDRGPMQKGEDKAEITNKANENTGSSSGKDLDIWKDPCIEFAIKTLTGSIHLDTDQNPKNCTQQQLGSPNPNPHHGGTDLLEVSLDNNLCQTDYYRGGKSFGSQKPVFKQPFADPTLQQAKNVGMGSSAGARVSNCGDDRKNAC